ncbi:hypothetical protein G210_3607 [Candida maltosa Xu316]|uniref:MMS19 nucleotide excision repair protein n=1 Tax=Candida maltosa (strain Xu316) TaxID=1245528 RepID=M3HG00_CANMX|nr:hypothetical protein G210_3607 [Candida maltosa Xu316]
MVESEHNIPVLINQYIAAIGNDEEATKTYINELSSLLGTNQLSLREFIQYLGPTLTGEAVIRSKSIQCLSNTISNLPTTTLTKYDINVLIDFLLMKFDDELSIVHALHGINYLIQCHQFIPSLNVEKILNKLLLNYNPKKHLAKVRHGTFEVLLSILSHQSYLTSKSEITNLYIKTFINIASGEKDPRNLLSSFELNEKINKIFSFDMNNDLHKQFVSELFDTCFCYFPISFKPPPNDPYKITADQLRQKLRATIASQSKFASDSFPSLIEKLTSTNPVIRNDTLKTIDLCVEKYDTLVVEEYWMTLWNALKFEILHNEIDSVFKPTNDTLIPENYNDIDDNDEFKPLVLTLVILNRLISKISQPEMMLQIVVDELKPNLEIIKDKSTKSSLILGSLGATSVECFNYVIDFLFQYDVWGKFLNIEQKKTDADVDIDVSEDVALNIAKQRDFVDSIGFILTSYQVLKPQNSHLSEYKDYILIFLGQLLNVTSEMEKTLKCKIVQQLIKLVKLPGFLNSNELDLILGNYFKNFMVNATKKDVILQEIVGGLVDGMQDPLVSTSTIELIINPLLNGLEDDNVDQYQFTLSIIGDLCVNYQVLEIISIRLLNKLPIINKSPNKFELYKIVINLFIKLIQQIEKIHQFLTNSWYKQFIPKFLSNVFIALDDDEEEKELYEITGDLVALIVNFIDVSKHQEILNQMNQVFISDDTSGAYIEYNSNLVVSPSNYISVYNKILSAIDKTSHFENNETVVDLVLKMIEKLQTNEYLRLQYLQTLALLVNKYVHNDEFIQSKMILPDKSPEKVIQFESSIWILKGLIVKLDGISYLDRLLELFESSNDQTVMKLIAKSLHVLFVDLKVFTNVTGIKANQIISHVKSLQVKLLYKQQLFTKILPILISPSPHHFEVRFYALSLIVENLSANILINHLSEIYPVVLKSFNEQLNPKSSLIILQIILKENKSILTDADIIHLLPILLTVSQT